MKNIFEKLSENIKTKEDLIYFLNQLGLIEKEIFKNIEVALSEKIKDKIADNFKKEIELLEEKKIILKDPEKNEIFFDKLKKYLKSLPRIKITIAFEPKRDFINKISLLIKKRAKKKMIIEFKVDPKIIAGEIIEYKGRQVNLSLDKKIEEIFTN